MPRITGTSPSHQAEIQTAADRVDVRGSQLLGSEVTGHATPPRNPRRSWPERFPRPVSNRWAAAPFGTIPDAAQHPLRHQEADRRNGLDEQRGPPPRVRVSLADQQPCCTARLLPQGKGPGEVVRRRRCAHWHATAQDQRPALLHHTDTQPDLRASLTSSPTLTSCHSGTTRSALRMAQPTRFSSTS